MLDLSNQIVMFLHVVEASGFSAASRKLGLTPSAVSKKVSRLEDHFNVRLLNRSTRGVSLTENGRIFYDHAKKIANDLRGLEELAVSMAGNVQGTLRAVASVAFGKSQLMPLIPAFLERYPELQLNLELSDRPVDLAAEGLDVAILFTEQITDHAAVMRKLATVRRFLCASAEYIDKYGAPETPLALLEHNCLRVSTVAHWNDWQVNALGENEREHASGNFQTNSADAIYHAVLAGLGVAQLSDYLLAEDLKTGKVVQILPDLINSRSDIVAIFPDRRNLSPNVRAFIDYLVEHFQPVPPWERGHPSLSAIEKAA
ncbi:MAG: LysR family transcriptional regulator [Gammaproteobacteria bacterium]